MILLKNDIKNYFSSSFFILDLHVISTVHTFRHEKYEKRVVYPYRSKVTAGIYLFMGAVFLYILIDLLT